MIVIAHPSNNDSCNFANSSNKENNALVRHSPLLSSILPKSTIKQFETDVLRRQAEYITRITDLEGVVPGHGDLDILLVILNKRVKVPSVRSILYSTT